MSDHMLEKRKELDAKIQEEHSRALAMFEAAVVVIRKTQTQNPKLILAKKELYKAETVTEFIAATELFKNTTTRNPRISEGKRLLFAAAKICSDAGSAASGSAAPPASVVLPSAAVDSGNKRPLAEVSGKAPVLIDLTFSSDEEDAPKAKKPAGGVAQSAKSAGKAPKEPTDLTFSSDEEDAPKAKKPAGGVAQSSKAAGKAPKEPEYFGPKMSMDPAEETCYCWEMGDLMGDGWNGLIVATMKQVQDLGKCAGFDALDKEATDQLRTLPIFVGEILLKKLRDEKKVSDVSAYIIQNAKKIRNQWGIDNPETIYVQMQEAHDATEKVVYASTYVNGYSEWHDDVKDAMSELKKLRKCGFSDLNIEATDELLTLPLDMALELLKALRHEKTGVDVSVVSEYVITAAQHLREQHDIPQPATVFEEMRDETGDTESDESIPRDENDNSIEY